jgi:hypothetical protein
VNLPSKRCAIYTRKSSEEGLDMSFNSLDAQRGACEAYILSQLHEGWTALSTTYDDGGFSGGNMERPGLKKLLAAISAGQVDTVVSIRLIGSLAPSLTLPRSSKPSTARASALSRSPNNSIRQVRWAA